MNKLIISFKIPGTIFDTFINRYRPDGLDLISELLQEGGLLKLTDKEIWHIELTGIEELPKEIKEKLPDKNNPGNYVQILRDISKEAQIIVTDGNFESMAISHVGNYVSFAMVRRACENLERATFGAKSNT